MTREHTNKNVPSRVDVNRRPEEEARQSFTERERETFFILLRRRKGEKEDKRERACPFPFLFLERERERRGILSSSSSR